MPAPAPDLAAQLQQLAHVLPQLLALAAQNGNGVKVGRSLTTA
jgi:hypothetical protein